MKNISAEMQKDKTFAIACGWVDDGEVDCGPESYFSTWYNAHVGKEMLWNTNSHRKLYLPSMN